MKSIRVSSIHCIGLLSCFLFTALIHQTTFAQEQVSQFQRPAGKVNCVEDKVKMCSYVSQNLSARELLAKIQANLFSGSILTPDKGYIVVDGIKKINFYMEEQSLREKLEAIIPLLDVLEDFNPTDLVLVTTEIFSLTEGGLSNLESSMVSGVDANNDITDWVMSSIFGGPSGVALKVGTNMVSSLLASSRMREESSRITTINQLIPNRSSLNYSNVSKIYIAPPQTGVVKEEEAGLKISGTPTISGLDDKVVLIKDFSLTYGVERNQNDLGKVEVLTVSNAELSLVKGVSSMVVSAVTSAESRASGGSVVTFGKKKEKVFNKLLIITRAEAIRFEDYVADMKKLLTMSLHHKFSPEQISKLKDDPIPMTQVLKKIKPETILTSSGDRVIKFYVHKEGARKHNYSKHIEVTVTAGGVFNPDFKQKSVVPLQTLMLSGLKLNSLPNKLLNEPVLPIKISLREYKSMESVDVILDYNTEDNSFIE